MRLIDADAILEAIRTDNPCAGLPWAATVCTMELLEYALTVDAVPVVRGRWIPHWKSNFKYECSVCHKGSDLSTPYCPHCGAQMEGDDIVCGVMFKGE